MLVVRLVLYLSAAVLAVAATNADRLSRGLSPARPKRLYDPSRPRASGSTQTYVAAVAWATAPSTTIGYFTGNGWDQATISTDGGITFTVPALDEPNQVLTSDFVLGDNGPYPYVCIRTPAGGNFGNGAGAALFGFDTISPDDSCKSNAFEVASSTGALSVTYPNSDSTTGYPNLYYYQAYDTIYLAGSAAEVNTVYDTQASESLKIILTAVPV
ncbi:hypothetical protein EHS25_008511 [Saitozyma podzolica]|uniref:Uncharacterized protein n=1 Tax=Saitozyma podzolica TaxID=1890683 RepID=A0A427YM24_9TREE|nr:hypothetical protein EHS25_008511 [Saitozyma podzolica]